jgi:hypothetical protein
MRALTVAATFSIVFVLIVGIQSNVFAESDDGSCPFKGEKSDKNSNSTSYSENHESNEVTQTNYDNYQIPSWIKTNAKWWASGQLNDSEFANGIKFLIDENIIAISNQDVKPMSASEIEAPRWVKATAGWWADGLVSDTEFVSGLEHLVNSGII